MTNKGTYSSERYKYILDRIKVLDGYIIDLQKRKETARVDESLIFDNLIKFYEDRKECLIRPLSQYYVITHSTNKSKIPFFIQQWEREFDELKRKEIFEFPSIDVAKAKIKRIKK